MISARHAAAKRYIAPRLITQMRIFSLVILAILGVVGYRLFLGNIGFGLAAAAVALGTVIGFAVGRTAEIFWHPETQKVASRIDALGVVFLVVYVVIEVGKSWFFGHWLAGAELSAFNLAFLAGLLSGRLLSMRGAIRLVLHEEKKIPRDTAKRPRT